MQNRPHTSVSYKLNKNGKLGNNGNNDEPSPFNNNKNNQNIPNRGGVIGSNNILNHNNNAMNMKSRSPGKVNPTIGLGGGQSNNTQTSQLPEISQKNKGPFQNLMKNKNSQASTQPYSGSSSNTIYSNSTNSDQMNVQNMNSSDFQDILMKEKDERYRYLLKHGTLKRIENNGNIIFSELPQIPGIWVCYRRPSERDICMEKLNLDYLDLKHIPLLEGEEKLKILTYQHNKMCKIENLVSLPTLLYLDLYDNQIKEIENLHPLTQLRVLLLPKNHINKIKNIDMLTKLEVLDLHSNKINKIEGISKLPNLRILNLANNLLTKIEGLESQTQLVELNLKINQIESLQNMSHLQKLEKLFVSNNRITDIDSISQLRHLSSLTELNLDGNPVCKMKFDYLSAILSNQKKLQTIDHKKIEDQREILKQEENKKKQEQNNNKNGQQQQQTQKNGKVGGNNVVGGKQNSENNNNSDKQSTIKQNQQTINSQSNQQEGQEDEEEDINPEEVIDIISDQWKKELDRVKQQDLQNITKKDLRKNTVVEGGHAEIEDDTILFIYGNAYEIVLQSETFQEIIQKIQFQYILFDFLIESHTLSILKEFKNLKEIVLKDNYVNSLLQLAKLETISSLRSITIENSPLCKCTYLKEFIVYRFPHITKINGRDVKEIDKQRAKSLFNHFDKILQLPEKFYNIDNVRKYPFEQNTNLKIQKDKSYMKLFTKNVNENAEKFVQSMIPKIIDENYQKQQMNRQIEQYLMDLIQYTLKDAN